jgi:hypothetical protein
MLRWSEKECQRRGVDATPEKRRQCLGDALFLVRYLTLSAKDFAQGPAKSGEVLSLLYFFTDFQRIGFTAGLLTQEECFIILMNIALPESYPIPDNMSLETEVRKMPPPNIATANLESSSRIYCTRLIILIIKRKNPKFINLFANLQSHDTRATLPEHLDFRLFGDFFS